MDSLPRVLILDDRETYLQALSRALRGRFAVVTAMTPDDALRLAAEDGPFAFALVDICLADETDPADRTGLIVIAKLQELPVPLSAVAMSAMDDPNLPEQASVAGAKAFLPKPIIVGDLYELAARFA